MSELLKIVLSLSLSGTLLLFIVLALKPLYKNKLSKRWQYYVWLIVIVRMLIPFTPETTLVGSAFQHLENINETIQITPSTNNTQADFDLNESNMLPNGQPQAPPPNMNTAPSISFQAIFSKVYENLWILWAAIAFALLIRKITMYQSFVRFVTAGWAEVSDIKILNMLADIGEAVGVKRPVELFTNPLISSPMLLGFFRPYIILPSIKPDNTELAYIMRHELTHYKHLDMFYKWLMQITVCLHWFNPFAYIMAKEINICCELSCDEAIIRTMDKDEKKAYGDTLLNSLKAMGNYKDKLATVTLTEGAEQLKERLDAIIRFKKKSSIIVAITLALTTTLCVGATAVGAYAAPKTAMHKTLETINKSNKTEVSYDKDYAEWNVTHVDDTYYYENLLGTVSLLQDLNTNTPWSVMRGTGQHYTYSQQGYYQGKYIFELGWNLNTNGFDAYSDKSIVKLSDGSTITVSFAKSCKSEARDNAVLADLKGLVERLMKRYANSSTPLEKPLVVSVKYVGDSDLVKLAEEYYKNDDLTSFSAVFSSLDATIQKEYCTKMIADENNAFLSSAAQNMESDMIDFCLENTYQEGKIALFTGIVPCLTDDQKETWATRASHDKKNTFFAVLTR